MAFGDEDEKKILRLADGLYKAKLLLLCTAILNVIFSLYSAFIISQTTYAFLSLFALLAFILNMIMAYAAYTHWRTTNQWQKKTPQNH